MLETPCRTRDCLFSCCHRGADQATRRWFQKADEPWQSLLARTVVLALPKRALQATDLRQSLPVTVQASLDAVFGIPLLKCFFIVDTPWWEHDRAPNTYAGNLPTRELHYRKNSKETTGWVMVYTDRSSLQFWSDYCRLSTGSKQDEAALWTREDPKDASDWQAVHRERLVAKFVQYARENGAEDFTADRVLACGIRDWGRDPYGGACHAWKPGAQSWKVMDLLQAFRLEGTAASGRANVHICGEAYCDYQGFIEGSLRSAARVLVHELGVELRTLVDAKAVRHVRL